MSKPALLHPALTLVAAVCLTACGGEQSRTAGERFVAGIASVDARVKPLAAGTTPAAATSPTITNDQLFAWAQLNFPQLLPGIPATFSGVVYQGKSYSGQGWSSGNYLAVANGEAWGLGPFTNNVLTNFGPVQTYAALVCADIDCGRSGPASTCTQPQGEALITGSKQVTTFVRSTFAPTASSGELTNTLVVDGPATFQGQAVVMTTSTTTSAGSSAASTVKSYLQAVDGGLLRTLGTDTSTSASGPVTRVLFSPTLQNSEFTLQAGQRVTKTASMSTSQLNPTLPATASTRSTTYTFEARETITVQGRSYDTCRYREAGLGSSAVNTTWYIVGSGIPARIETREGNTLQQRLELKSGTINDAPLSPGQAPLDAAAAEHLVTDFSYILPVCSPGGSPKPFPPSAASYLRKVQDLRKLALAAAANSATPPRRALAYTSTKPADQLGECGGRQTYPSYSHLNGVTTATLRWESYCSQDSDTGARTVLNGSWSFVETATPGSSGPIRTKYEASSPAGISIVNTEASGKTIGSQLISVLGYVSAPGVPGGDATAAKPDRLQAAEIRVRNDLTGKTYRQTGYTVTSFTTASGGEQMTMSGRGYRSSSGYFDLTTSKPIVTDDDGNYLSGTLVSTGANGEAVVITIVPGEQMQGTMTVNGQPVTNAPACK